MANHFHWLLETPEANLVAGMKWFLGAYSQRFNARHGQRGHVFQGRYKAVVVEAGSGEYFETVSTYIHLNPARVPLTSDWNLEPEQIAVALERSVSRVVDAETGEAIANESGKLQLTLGGYGVRLLRFESL